MWLLGSILAITVHLIPGVPKEPKFKDNGATYGHYLAINPKSFPVDMEIFCIGEFEPVTIVVPAKSTVDVDIDSGTAVSTYCWLESWKKHK